MATANNEDGFQKWKDGIDRANGDWNAYDGVIQSIVIDYNRHLQTTPWFRGLDWRLVKAIMWTESGAHDREWKRKPLQIGVRDDPGLSALLGGREGGDLVIPPSYSITPKAAMTFPRENIAAGIGYLLMRMADYGFVTVPDKDSAIFDVTVRPGDTGLGSVARSCRSTPETLEKLNPGVRVIRAGQVLKCQKASVQKVITGWKSFTYTTVARRYNGGGNPLGDPRYAEKLEYAMSAIRARAQ
jgi:hypothetical protein